MVYNTYSMKKYIGVGLIGLIVIGGFIFFAAGSRKPVELRTERTNREIAVTCDPQMAEAFHIHPILEIIVNSQKIDIPANIGVERTCMTAIHTHTPDGTIHVESPEKRDFTLSDFFAVWEQPFSKDALLTYTTDATHRIHITVDGKQVDTYENTILKDDERIVIFYDTVLEAKAAGDEPPES